MTRTNAPRNLLGIGDAISVLVSLGLNEFGERQRACGLLGYSLLAPLPAYHPPPPPDPGPPELSRRQSPQLSEPKLPAVNEDFETEPPAADLPPAERGKFEVLPLPASERPTRDPLGPRPNMPVAPAKRPLLARRYERAILQGLCLVERVSSQPNVGAIAKLLEKRMPLTRLPRLMSRRVAPRLVLWLDVSQSMQVFNEDLDRLEATLRRLLAGSSVLSVSHWVGIPRPGRKALATVPAIGSGTSARQVVLLASDLGGGGQKTGRIGLRTNAQYLQTWSRILPRAETKLALLVPLPSKRWESARCETVSGVEWSRLSKPDRTLRHDKRRSSALRIGALATDAVPALELRRLARACSLSARITPALLRQLRLELLPHLGSEAEAEFWSASFIREASTLAAVLMPDEADALRSELPHYSELVTWLEEAGFLTDDEIASLRPTVSIDDGFDDLWVGRSLPPNRLVAPSAWTTALAVLSGVFKRLDCRPKAVAAYPNWRNELEALGRGRSPVFAEQVRQICLMHTLRHPHLQLEDALTWHGLRAGHGDDASIVRIDALVAAIQILIVDPEDASSSKRLLDWLRRRHGDFSEALRSRRDIQRIIHIVGRRSAGSAMTPAAYEPTDIYIAPSGNAVALSLSPLPDAFRVRGVASEGVSLTVGQGSAHRAVLLRRSAQVRVDRDIGEDLSIRTFVGDTYRIPLKEPSEAPLASGAKFWLEQTAEEGERRDWIAAMRWADKALASDDIEIDDFLHATTLFVEAACCADRRVATAFDRISAVERRLSTGFDCLESEGVTAEALMRLTIASVELCLEDSRLTVAIRSAQQYLDAVRARGYPPELTVPAARLAARLTVAFLRRGDWPRARDTLLLAEELTLRESDDGNKVRAWYAITAGNCAHHAYIRKDGKRALRALSECSGGNDPILTAELELTKLELKASFALGGATNLDFRNCLAAARRAGNQPLIRSALRRTARHNFHAGNIQESDHIVRQLSIETLKARSPYSKTTILMELAYQASRRSKSAANGYLEEARALAPEEEVTLSHVVLREHLTDVRSSQFTSSNPSVRSLLEYWAESGELGEFANGASTIAFEPGADWVATLLYRQAGGSTPADALRRICRTMGATLYTINTLTAVGRNELDLKRAADDFRFAMQIAEGLRGAAYAVYVGNQAVWRFIEWEKWQSPGQHRNSNEIALRLINRGIAAATASPTVESFRLISCQAAAYHLLDLGAEAIKAARHAQQLARQLDLPAEIASAYALEGCIAFHAGDLLEAARSLQIARRMWSERRHEQPGKHPYDFGYVGVLILDACEWFKGRKSGELSPAETSFIDDVVWFANDFYVPRLPESTKETNWINDFWYAVSQVQDLPSPNVIAAYEALTEAEQHRDPSSRLVRVFRDASGKLRRRSGLAAIGDEPPIFGPGPPISSVTPFLTFTELREPGSWLRSGLTSVSEDVLTNRPEQVLRVASLSFWPGAKLLAIGVGGRQDQHEQFALFWENDEILMLDWTNEPIYAAVDRHPLSWATDEEAILYSKFFFQFVRGQLGRFIIVETLVEIPWLSTADRASETDTSHRRFDVSVAQAKVAALLQPLAVIQRTDNLITLQGTVVFKHALFRTKILLSVIAQSVPLADGSGTEYMSRGQLRLFDEELLEEEMPVFVDQAAGPYG